MRMKKPDNNDKKHDQQELLRYRIFRYEFSDFVHGNKSNNIFK